MKLVQTRHEQFFSANAGGLLLTALVLSFVGVMKLTFDSIWDGAAQEEIAKKTESVEIIQMKLSACEKIETKSTKEHCLANAVK